MKEQIKELRLSCDGLSQLTHNLKPLRYIESYKDYKDSNSNEINKAYDSLILAKAWLGKLLQELGEATPYANDGNRKDVKDIEAAADTYEIKFTTTEIDGIKISSPEYSGLLVMNHIEKVDWLREEVGKVVEEVKSLFSTELTDRFNKVKWSGIQVLNIENCYNNILTNLSEARFWLGFELGRIRDEK
mgnify:CR=1 FL=1